MQFAIDITFRHNDNMNSSKWQEARDILQLTFHMLLVIFTVILFIDTFTNGLISSKYVNLDYALVIVLFYGAIFILLELMRKRGQ